MTRKTAELIINKDAKAMTEFGKIVSSRLGAYKAKTNNLLDDSTKKLEVLNQEILYKLKGSNYIGFQCSILEIAGWLKSNIDIKYNKNQIVVKNDDGKEVEITMINFIKFFCELIGEIDLSDLLKTFLIGKYSDKNLIANVIDNYNKFQLQDNGEICLNETEIYNFWNVLQDNFH
jgi:hypothetical protein